MSWYRTYRPQEITQLDLTQVREQLLSLLHAGNIPHALLFSGPKGTGKTSSARIVAKVLNCEKNADVQPGKPLHEPCGTCEMCLAITQGSSMNVVEMDAASNRRIDDIRELRERIYMPPAQGKKLVYIIDEVHMLTNEAFNALLKILEEPPEHAVFILATTEHHKIPETILSRCTQIAFHKASAEEIQHALEGIAKQEKITIEDAVFAHIVQHADGSFRDAVKVFEQLVERSGEKKLTVQYVETQLASVSSGDIETFARHILAKDEQAVVKQFVLWQQQNISPTVIHEQILSFLHTELLKSLGITQGTSIANTKVLQFLLKNLGNISCDTRLPFPLLPLEMEIVEIILKSKEQQERQSGNSSPPTSSIKKSVMQKHNEKEKSAPSKVAEADSTYSTDPLTSPFESDSVVEKENGGASFSASLVNGQPLAEKWNDFLSLVGRQNVSVEALLRSSQFLSGADGVAKIQVYYQFHKEQLELDRYRTIIETSIEQLLGGRVKVEYELTKSAVQKGQTEESNISGKVEDSLVDLAEELVVSA